VIIVVAERVAGAAPSGVSDTVADVVWVPGVVENVTDALMAPRVVPALIGVASVEVQVTTVLAADRAHDNPVGVGTEANVAPLGAAAVNTGSLCAGPPTPAIEGVITTVLVEPATAFDGPTTVTARTGGPAVVVVVVESVAGVAPSGVSDKVADVVWIPGIAENVTDAPMAPRAVPGAIGVGVVAAQVSTVLAAESRHDHPAGVGAAVNVPPLGAVTVTTGSA